MLHFVLYDMESSTVVDILKEPPHFYLYIIDICHAFVLRKPLSEWKANMNREREYLEEKVSYEGHKKVGNFHNSLTRNLLIYYAILSNGNIPDFGAKIQMRWNMYFLNFHAKIKINSVQPQNKEQNGGYWGQSSFSDQFFSSTFDLLCYFLITCPKIPSNRL